MKKAIFIFLTLLSGILYSCKDNSTVSSTSSKAEITAFYFAKNDSFPSIGSTVFRILNYNAADTGLIYNIDSMAYQTPIKSLIPKFRFAATPASVSLILPDTSYYLTGSDTLDFSKRPVILQVLSSDTTTKKYYRVEVNAHQVDPDRFVWKTLTSSIFATDGASTRAFFLNGNLVVLSNNGFANSVYTSLDGLVWNAAGTPVGLPDNCRVRNIIVAGDSALYYADGDMLYTSTDALTWKPRDLSTETYRLVNMLMFFNDSVWAIAENRADNTYHLAVENDDNWVLRVEELPASWPVSEFATVVFRSSSLRPRAMIVGGYDKDGRGINSRWNIEYSDIAGYRFANFSIVRPMCSAIIGASIISYNNMLYMFGGEDADGDYITNAVMCSTDEGFSWYESDTVHNRLMDIYTKRTRQTALVGTDKNVYLVGGQSRTETYTDVVRGRVNSIDFKKKD